MSSVNSNINRYFNAYDRDSSLLEDIVKKYPASALARLLLAKKYKDEARDDFETVRNQTALYMTNVPWYLFVMDQVGAYKEEEHVVTAPQPDPVSSEPAETDAEGITLSSDADHLTPDGVIAAEDISGPAENEPDLPLLAPEDAVAEAPANEVSDMGVPRVTDERAGMPEEEVVETSTGTLAEHYGDNETTAEDGTTDEATAAEAAPAFAATEELPDAVTDDGEEASDASEQETGPVSTENSADADLQDHGEQEQAGPAETTPHELQDGWYVETTRESDADADNADEATSGEQTPHAPGQIAEEEQEVQRGDGIQLETPEKDASTSSTPAVEPGSGDLEFEPLYTVDYFASQGIKLNEEDLKDDKLSQQVKSFTGWLKSMKKLHPGKLPEQNEVIGQIIQNAAEISNVEADVLTEAMAEVLVKQNKKDKAIEMYEKLSLMNPGKSAYFAAKIENLKTT